MNAFDKFTLSADKSARLRTKSAIDKLKEWANDNEWLKAFKFLFEKNPGWD